MTDSVYRKDENYYPQVFFKKTTIHSDDSNDSSDSNDSNKKISMKEIQMKKIKYINLYLQKRET